MFATFVISTANSPNASATNFTGIEGPGSWNASESLVYQPVPHALTADQLRITCLTAPGTGKSYAYTVMKNGSPTGITCTISGSAGTAAADTANSAAFAAGDTISLKSVPSGTPTVPAQLRVTLRQSASGKFAVLGGNSTSAITSSWFNNVQGAGANGNATETSTIGLVACACTASNLRVISDVDPTPGNWTFTLRREVGDSLITTNLAAGNTTASDTSNTAAFTAGQRWAMHIVAAATPASSRLQWGMSVTPASDGDSFWSQGNANQYDTASARMVRINGNIGSLGTADSATYSGVQAGTATALYVYFQTNPGGTTKLYTAGVFKAGTATALSLTSNAVGLASITGQSVTVADDDFLNIDVVPSGTPTASRIYTGILFTQSAGVTTPVNSVAPVASGTASKTFAFTSTTGTWTNSPTATSYQWQRDVAGNLSYSNIASATAANYTATSADTGCHVRCVVTASNAAGSTTAASNALGPVGDALAVVSSVGAEWCANATVVYSVGSPTTPTYLNPSTAAQTTGWSSWYV